jgi:hypothetical protein
MLLIGRRRRVPNTTKNISVIFISYVMGCCTAEELDAAELAYCLSQLLKV